MKHWLTLFPTMSESGSPIGSALAAAAARTSDWDALLVATAAEGGLAVILTDDTADEGVGIVNPVDRVGLSASALLLLPTA